MTPANPILSQATREGIAKLVATYPDKRTALLPALKLAQQETVYLPPPVVAEVADLVGVSHAGAFELVAFYNMLQPHFEGMHRVVVCAQLPCALNGADRLLRDLAAGLGIQSGEMTPDGLLYLERTSECFGSCDRAPMARVNDDYAENLTPDATPAFIERLKQLPPRPLPIPDSPSPSANGHH